LVELVANLLVVLDQEFVVWVGWVGDGQLRLNVLKNPVQLVSLKENTLLILVMSSFRLYCRWRCEIAICFLVRPFSGLGLECFAITTFSLSHLERPECSPFPTKPLTLWIRCQGMLTVFPLLAGEGEAALQPHV